MPNSDDAFSKPLRPHFESTQWSLIVQAKHRSSPAGRAALAELCQRYWYPLFAYVRSLGNDLHQAQDLTQGFFERLLDKDYVSDADPARGKFRTFLLTSLTHFMANEYDKRATRKRGGDRRHFPLEFEGAERRFSMEPTTGSCPETRFEQQWARTLLDRVVVQLQQKYEAAGKAALFANLKQFLVAGGIESAATIAERLEMGESAVRVAAHRLRSEYRAMLRGEIAATVGNANEVDEEIAALFETFARH